LKKADPELSPIVVSNRRQIATSFWGRAWCRQIEAYRDLEYRLERGRSYVRAGAVVDLKIEGQRVKAQVVGNELYQVTILFKALDPELWTEFIAKSAGHIDSVLALLSGKIPDAISQLMADPEAGIFPSPEEIKYSCTCLDEADLCKHTAATLYGIGVRFDQQPELFFGLRGVDPEDLLRHHTALLASSAPSGDESSLSAADLFDIELL
jgi:uncharacterized Zn finger protein